MHDLWATLKIIIFNVAINRDKWKRCLHGLYNDPNPVNIVNLPNIPEYAERESIPRFSQAEGESAESKLSGKKAVGPDEISAEEIQAAASEKGLVIVHSLCTKVGDSEHVPDEWKRAIIVPIFRKKDKIDCNNYWGVSLPCHCSKIFFHIILHWLRKKTKEILSKEQAGFRANRSTLTRYLHFCKFRRSI